MSFVSLGKALNSDCSLALWVPFKAEKRYIRNNSLSPFSLVPLPSLFSLPSRGVAVHLVLAVQLEVICNQKLFKRHGLQEQLAASLSRNLPCWYDSFLQLNSVIYFSFILPVLLRYFLPPAFLIRTLQHQPTSPGPTSLFSPLQHPWPSNHHAKKQHFSLS